MTAVSSLTRPLARPLLVALGVILWLGSTSIQAQSSDTAGASTASTLSGAETSTKVIRRHPGHGRLEVKRRERTTKQAQRTDEESRRSFENNVDRRRQRTRGGLG